MTEITIDTTFINNMILILDCLGDDEMQTGRHLFESLRDLQDIKLTGHCRYLRVSNRAEFVHALAKVRNLCVRNWPILHIEAHGDEARGLSIGNAAETYGWEDLANEMRLCNAACKHSFGVVLAACHGRYLESQVSAIKEAPFHFLISCKKAMSAMDMERYMLRFYTTFLQTVSLEQASSTLPDEASVFRSHMFFLAEYGRHYKKRLMGKGREKQVETLLSNMAKHQIARQYLGVKKLREIAKDVTAVSEKKYVEQSQRFFHGNVPIPYSEFMHYLRTLPRAPEDFYDQ